MKTHTDLRFNYSFPLKRLCKLKYKARNIFSESIINADIYIVQVGTGIAGRGGMKFLKLPWAAAYRFSVYFHIFATWQKKQNYTEGTSIKGSTTSLS